MCQSAYCYTHTGSLVPSQHFGHRTEMTCRCRHRTHLRTATLPQRCSSLLCRYAPIPICFSALIEDAPVHASTFTVSTNK